MRLRVLEDAGRLSIPFTTGLLVGIGETLQERAESIFALRRVATAYGHVQEVIVQNFRAKPDTAMRSVDDLEVEEYLAAVAVTRLVMGPRMRVQAPPNLVDLAECRDLLAAGVDDWGGVSPLTPDHVNPERPWPTLERLREVTADSGFELRARLTAHPRYVLAGDPWIDPRVRPHVAALAGPDGLLADGVRPRGLPWQEPDGGALSGDEHAAGWGRTDLHATIDTTGRTTDRRTDFDDVYGDWATLRAQVNPATSTPPSTTQTPAPTGDPSAPHPGLPGPAEHGTGPDLAERAAEATPEGAGVDGTGPPGATKERRGWLPAPSGGASADRAFTSALTQAERDPQKLTDEQALSLFTAEGQDLDAVRALADHLRHETVGDDVTYVLNRNINFTNVCYTGCRFCAFAQRRTDADAFSLSLEQVADRAEEAWGLGATEVCMQGGIDPELPGTAYFDLASAVKRRVPQMHVHAFSPMEVVNGATRTGLSIHDWLLKAKESGLDSIPGTAAEILDDEVRWVLTKGKLPTSAWVEVVSTAHRLGIRSSSTMMYGHVDRPEHWVTHLRVIQRVHDAALEAGVAGFTEFVPLPFVHTSAPIYLAGVARPGPSLRDNLAVHAVARIMLHGRIDHIQTSWVKLGVEGTRLMLQSGCDDLGGTLMEETISRMAGSEHGSAKTVAELTEIAAGVGRPVRQRTTTYGEVPTRLTWSEAAHDAGRGADRDHVGGQVAGDDRAGADHGVVADADAGADDDAAAEPDVVADGDGLGGLPLVAAGAGIERVGGGEQLHVGADLHVVADGDGGDVEDDEPEVGEGAGSDAGLVAVVAAERRPDLAALAVRPQQLGEQLPQQRRVGRVGGVDAVGQAQGAELVGDDLRVVGEVGLAGEHPLAHAGFAHPGTCHDARGSVSVIPAAPEVAVQVADLGQDGGELLVVGRAQLVEHRREEPVGLLEGLLQRAESWECHEGASLAPGSGTRTAATIRAHRRQGRDVRR